MTREEFENRRVSSSTGTVYATIAPYYNTRITDSNKKEITEKVQKVFLSKAKQVAKGLGVSIKSVSNNIGGFTFQEGETIGEQVRELSYSFELNTSDTQKADLFAAIMGA